MVSTHQDLPWDESMLFPTGFGRAMDYSELIISLSCRGITKVQALLS